MSLRLVELNLRVRLGDVYVMRDKVRKINRNLVGHGKNLNFNLEVIVIYSMMES